MSNRLRIMGADGVVSTTDGVTNTVVVSYDLSSTILGSVNGAAHVVARLVGRDSSGNAVGGQFAATFQRISGTLTNAGAALQTIGAFLGTSALLASVTSFAVSGNIIQLKVIGVALTTIEWYGTMDIIIN